MSGLDVLDGTLEVQPPVTEQHLAQLPAKRGVALLLAEGDLPITLLPCADLRSRVAARMRNPEEDPRQKMPDLRGITRRILWRLTGGHFETDLCFLELARKLWPKAYPKMLAFRKAAFVRVDPGEKYPRFAREEDAVGKPGRCFGPFSSGRSADRFVEAVQEAFDLCRDDRCLRQSPRGARCSYGQMGRCLCPCDGSLPMEQYRRSVAEAAAYVAGDRQRLRDQLTAEMKQAAGQLQFEAAAAIKARLERLAALEHEDFRLAAPVEEFRFLLVQPGIASRTAHVFFADGGEVVQLPNLDYPLQEAQIKATLEAVLQGNRILVARTSCPRVPRASRPQNTGKSAGKMPAERADETSTPLLNATLRLPWAVLQAPRQAGQSDPDAGQWRMALVSHYLYSSIERSGLVLRVRPSLTPEELSAQIEEAAEALRLIRPRRNVEGNPASKEEISEPHGATGPNATPPDDAGKKDR